MLESRHTCDWCYSLQLIRGLESQHATQERILGEGLGEQEVISHVISLIISLFGNLEVFFISFLLLYP